jgi:hypothetical protein
LKSSKTLAPFLLASLCFFAFSSYPAPVAATEIAPADAELEKNPATKPTDFTLVEAHPSISPRAFEGSDGVTNLVYELILTNFNTKPITVENIEITNANDGKVLLTLTTEQLKSVMKSPAVKKQKGKMTPGAISIVFVNITLDKDATVPSMLVHKITYSGTIIEKRQTKTTNLAVDVDKTAPLVIGSPLVGKKWLATGGYSSASGHRRSLFPVNNELKSAQRFALDWVQLNDENRLFSGNGKENTQFVGYGKPVLAVGDGTIYGVVNKFEDQPPFKASGSMTYPGGNTITLKLSDKAYAMYAHLKPGSIKVKEGDTVKKGQVIAEVGNVGNSDAPHLHLHITESPAILESNGVPYVFEQFDVAGAIDIVYMERNFQKPGSLPTVKVERPGVHKFQLVKEGLLIDFPELKVQEAR